MKNIFLCILLLACTVLPHLVQAQVIKASPDGDACPNTDYTYTYTGSALGCKWVVKGAYTLVSGGGSNYGSITVRWSDLPTDATSNPTSIIMDCGTNGSTTSVVFVSSISNVTPGPLTVNGTVVGSPYLLPFGDNTALTLKVPLVDMPKSGGSGTPTYPALTYRWLIPSGWRYNDGSNIVSDGVTTHDVGNGGQGNYVSVTPHPANGGTISVQAVSTNCLNSTTGPPNSISKPYSIDVARSTPKLTIISDKSPNGGNFTITCGDRSDYHFRSISESYPTGGSISNYVFTFNGAGVITPTTDVPGPSPASNFTGATGTARVELRALYTRNGVSRLIGAPDVAITVRPLAQPVITSSVASPGPGLYPSLCGSATLTLSTSVVGATSYTWTATGGLGIGSPGTSTLTTSGTSVTIFPGSGGGSGLVSVVAANTTVNSCSSPASAGYGVAYGGPVAHNGSLLMHSDRFDYESNCPYGCAGICPESRVTMQPRDPSPGSLQQAVWRVYRTDVSPAALVTTQTYSGAAANGSRLDYTFIGAAVGSRYQVQLQERNACGQGGITTYSLEIINCGGGGGGEEPFRKANSQATAYPNPADDELILEQDGGPISLTNGQGRAVRSQTAKPGRVHLDTRHLPAGLYFLEMRDSEGQPVRQQIRIAH